MTASAMTSPSPEQVAAAKQIDDALKSYLRGKYTDGNGDVRTRVDVIAQALAERDGAGRAAAFAEAARIAEEIGAKGNFRAVEQIAAALRAAGAA